MDTTELIVIVDETALRKAETVFQELGLETSTAINIFLTQVWLSKDIHFPTDLDRARVLDVEGYSMEQCFRAAVRKEIAETKARGNPVALYDAELKKPYFEYPDGRREYNK